MKKLLLLVLISAMGEMYAYSQQIFSFQPDFKKYYKIDLENGERLEMQFASEDMLQYPPSLDSILQIFWNDVKMYRDSMSYSPYGYRVDYVMEDSSRNKIRIRKSPPQADYLVATKGQLSQMKMDQDTLIITGIHGPPERDYRYTLYMNFLGNLDKYAGQIDERISQMYREIAMQDTTNDPVIVQNTPSTGKKVIYMRPSVDIQNYRDKFIPSISLDYVITKRKDNVYTEFGITSEFHFHFAQDAAGNNRTYLNPFITLKYGRGKMNEQNQVPGILFPAISVSYLVKPRGDLYGDHTFRLGFGRFFLGGNKATKIEPSIYINDFFKSATPSLRLVQMF